ncbi:MAG: hypothetical protein ACYTG4_08500 [Planctomycetota bacterium]|jgi:hypothetical protein
MTNAHRILAVAALVLLPVAPAFAQDEAPAEKKDPETAKLEALAKQAAPKVEETRGMKFKDAVPVAPITKEAFLDKYITDMETFLGGEDKAEPATRLLRRLGAIAKDEDLMGILEEYLPQTVAAIYDWRTKRVSFLPGQPAQLPTMVHELTHALDDQEFDFDSQMKHITGELDRGLAFGSLVEGDATSVEQRFFTGGMIANIPIENLRMMANQQAAMLLKRKDRAAPPAIAIAFASQYSEGVVFAESLRRGPKNEEAINDAFRSPPTSTEQILHPEKYQAGENPVVVRFAALPENATSAMETTLGELGTRIMLLGRSVDQATATKASAGWAGDRIGLIAFPEGKEAVVWVSDWDTDADAEEFRAALTAAYPVTTGSSSNDMTRGFVAQGKTIIYVEAPLDVLAEAMTIAKSATHTASEATPREGVLQPPVKAKEPPK